MEDPATPMQPCHKETQMDILRDIIVLENKSLLFIKKRSHAIYISIEETCYHFMQINMHLLKFQFLLKLLNLLK